MNNSVVNKAIIVAAGLGSRLGSMTASIPKCLVTVNGRTILDYQLHAFRSNGVVDISIVTGYRGDSIVEPGLRYYCNPRYRDTNTLWSLMSARAQMNGPFIASYGDILYSPDVIEKLLLDDRGNRMVVK